MILTTFPKAMKKPSTPRRLNGVLKTVALAGTAMLFGACSTAGDRHAVGASVGTTGISLDAKTQISPEIVLRGSLNTLPISRDETFDGVDYDADLNFTNVGGFIEYFPFGNAFHMTGGFYAGEKSADLIGTPNAATNITLGNDVFTGAEIGTLIGQVEYEDIAPYLGVGYDSFLKPGSAWSFNAKAGIMMMGDPDVTLRATGGLSSSTPLVQNAVNQERDNLEEEVEDYKYFPVVTVGVSRHF